MPVTKYAKTLFSRLAGFRTSVITPRRMFRRKAKRGRRL